MERSTIVPRRPAPQARRSAVEPTRLSARVSKHRQEVKRFALSRSDGAKCDREQALDLRAKMAHDPRP